MLQLIDERVVAAKTSGRLHVRVQGTGRKLFGCGTLRPLHTDIPKSVEGKVRHHRHPCLFIPVQISVGTAGLSKIFRIKISVLIKRLRMPDHQFPAVSLRQPDFYNPRHVLPEIKHELSLWGDDFLRHGKALRHADRLRLLRHDLSDLSVFFKQDCFADDFFFHGKILRLPVIDLGKADRSGLHIPVCVRSQELCLSVPVLDTDHCQYCRPVSVVVRLVLKAQLSFVPTVSDGNLNAILLCQKISNVVRLVLNPVMI